jgi:hypothetical protein
VIALKEERAKKSTSFIAEMMSELYGRYYFSFSIIPHKLLELTNKII